LSGDEDPCKAQKDDLNANQTALEANIEGVPNDGLTHGTPEEIETMLKAYKRLFLLSTVQPNAEAQHYAEFMDMLVEQRDLWNHTHDEDEAEGEAAPDQEHKDCEATRTKADALAVKSIQSFVTFINETIVEAEKAHAASNATEDFVIDHDNLYQGAYKIYLNDAEKVTIGILDAIIKVEEDAD